MFERRGPVAVELTWTPPGGRKPGSPEPGSLSADAMAAVAQMMRPGPASIEVLDRIDRSALSDDGRIDFLQAHEQASRWLASLGLAALGEHCPEPPPEHRPQPDDGLPRRDKSRWDEEGRVLELVLALNTGESWMYEQVRLARALHPLGRLAATGLALQTGDVSVLQARILAELTEELSPDQSAVVQARVLPNAEYSPADFRRAVRRAVVAVDADAIANRHRAKVTQRNVSWWPEPDGMATMQMFASAPDVLAVYSAVDELARPRDADDPRSVDARRCDALLAMASSAVDSGRSGPMRDGTQAGSVSDPDAAPRRAKGTEAHVVIDLATLLGLADRPGELRGYGPIPSAVAREWLSEATTWRRLVTDPVSGTLLDYGPRVRFAPGRLRRFLAARDGTCGFPGCTARADGAHVEMDHHPPWRDDGTGGSTNAEGMGVLCAHHHHIRTHGGWTLVDRVHGTSTWSSPTGRSYRTTSGSPLPD